MLQEMHHTVPRRFRTRPISTVGAHIISKLSEEIKCSRLFSVLADEAADVSYKENMSMVVRFVDTSRNMREEFVGFHLCEEGTSGEAIKQLILNAISDLGLSMDDCRGQSYDGAGNMAGRYVGASTLIQGAFKKALYVYCMNHRLNLCVADTCSLQMVKNMMGTVRKLSAFFSNSPKRQHHLVNKIKSLLPTSKHRVLIDVCRTRWISRIDGLDRIVELFIAILAALEDIRLNKNSEDGAAGTGNWNSNSRDDAQVLSNGINFQFIVSLVIVRYILDLTRPATVKLQREEILKAEQEISNLKETLEDFQSNIDEEHNRVYQEAVQLAGEIEIEPSQPRTVQRQVHRNNAPSTSPNEYYKINLTRVFLDHALQQLHSRFPREAYTCYKGMSIVPAVLLNNLPT